MAHVLAPFYLLGLLNHALHTSTNRTKSLLRLNFWYLMTYNQGCSIQVPSFLLESPLMHTNGLNSISRTEIQKLKSEKVMPSMKILGTVEKKEMAIEQEKYWIHYYLERGVQLTNQQVYPVKHAKPQAIRMQRENVSPSQKQISASKRSRVDEAKKLYDTAGEVMEMLNISRTVLHYMIERGEIPEGIKIPLRRQALFRRTDVDRLVEERERYLNEPG